MNRFLASFIRKQWESLRGRRDVFDLDYFELANVSNVSSDCKRNSKIKLARARVRSILNLNEKSIMLLRLEIGNESSDVPQDSNNCRLEKRRLKKSWRAKDGRMLGGMSLSLSF